MSDYVIYADSACDINTKTLKNWGVSYSELTFMFDGSNREYLNYDIGAKDFYDSMRAKKTVKTSAVSSGVFYDEFKKILLEGKNILYIGFSSGLSSTFQNANMAANDLLEEFPSRKIITVDSLSASTGYGFILGLAVDKKNEGATMEEVASYVEDIKLKINHWFTVDDITYLQKGGRIGSAAAKVASKIGIKPVLHVNDEGRLVFRYIVRGKKAAFKALLEEYAQRAKIGGKLYICHCDYPEAVERLAELFKEHFGVSFDRIEDVGPVIGGHTGPGTVGIFFEGAGR